MSDALRLERIVRRFHQGEAELEVLRGASLELAPSEVVALVGPSGSGKSTLLQIAGLLEHADGGEVVIAEQACSALNDGERTRIRRDALGFVYQFHHLLPEFSALENVLLPQMIAGRSRAESRERAEGLLGALGLGQRLQHRPARLSGGEQQRVAIARALVNRPKVVLADEPTGNLDEATGLAVFEALTAAIRATRAAALIATHNPDLATRADRILRLHDGLIEAVPTTSRKTA
ncbi:MAG: ABC transporter ATP-binding protein [Geminicoccaceae bacterium]|nr:ABC transporter ATP-binding protein [Geminicoccaceae bacterium]